MSWQPEIDEIKRRGELARKMGEPSRVQRHKDGGKLNIRERLDALVDAGSFEELGSIAGEVAYDTDGKLATYVPSSFILGYATLDGRTVMVGGNDFTIRGGYADVATDRKWMYLEQIAAKMQLPIVRLIDGVGGSVKTVERIGHTYLPNNPGAALIADNLSRVPVVSLGLGIVAGFQVVLFATSHYSLMVRGTSHMFMAGPPVVARLGQTVTKEELGGAEMQARAGNVDDVVDSEQEAFARARTFLSYLPSSVEELAERIPSDDPVDRAEQWLIEAIPRDRRKVYDMRRILRAVVDQGSLFEMGRLFGGSAITAFARLGGWPVAIVASNPHIYGGGWTADTARKVTRFVDLASIFHLPLVNLVDVPGFVIGLESEKAGTIRFGVRAMAAIAQATVPACTIIVRKSFGVAGGAHADHMQAQVRYAWPSGDWGSMPIEGGIEAAYKRDIEESPDPAARQREIEVMLEGFRSPIRTAEAFGVEEIIDPRHTRHVLCRFAGMAARLRKPGTSYFKVRP